MGMCAQDAATSPRAGSAGAGRAGAEDLQGVADVGVTVLGRDPVGPALHRRAGHLDGAPAGPADQVVVVALAAPAVEVLAAGRAHHVDLAGVGEPLQGAVDGGQPDPLAALAAACACRSWALWKPSTSAEQRRSPRSAAGCCARAARARAHDRLPGVADRVGHDVRDVLVDQARTRSPGRAAARAPRRPRAAPAGAGRPAAAARRASRPARARSARRAASSLTMASRIGADEGAQQLAGALERRRSPSRRSSCNGNPSPADARWSGSAQHAPRAARRRPRSAGRRPAAQRPHSRADRRATTRNEAIATSTTVAPGAVSRWPPPRRPAPAANSPSAMAARHGAAEAPGRPAGRWPPAPPSAR